jgi:FtsP/CotA-like multicopper oxidase with cupredoxin domain
VQRDFCFLLNAYDMEPGSMTPKVNTMTGLQHLVLEQPRLSLASTPLNGALGDKVRIRVGNLTMTNHPIHLHGHEFWSPAPMAAPRPKARAGPK